MALQSEYFLLYYIHCHLLLLLSLRQARARARCSPLRLSRIKNKRELNASLKGATLGDADDVDDTLKWIKRNKKKAKEMARKRQEELEDMDKAFQGEDYTESVSRLILGYVLKLTLMHRGSRRA